MNNEQPWPSFADPHNGVPSGLHTTQQPSGSTSMQEHWLHGSSAEDSRFPPPSPALGADVSSFDDVGIDRTPSESKPAFLMRISGAPTRQRTAQACEKCRERKTKCSGERPVCGRCTTRGLICEYSCRDTRLRGLSKSRLHNTISFVDLTPDTVNPIGTQEISWKRRTQSGSTESPAFSHRHDLEMHHIQLAQPFRRTHGVSRPHSASMPNSPVFGGAPQARSSPFTHASDKFESNVNNANTQAIHTSRGVRHVHSQSSLLGARRGNPSMQQGNTHTPVQSLGGAASYGLGINNIRNSGMIQRLARFPSGFIPSDGEQLYSQQDLAHTWKRHCTDDVGSPSSAPPMTHQSSPGASYSPTSSEDAPEPHSRCPSSLAISLPLPFLYPYLYDHPGSSDYRHNTSSHCSSFSVNSFDANSPNIDGPKWEGGESLSTHTVQLAYPSPITPIGVSAWQDVGEIGNYAGFATANNKELHYGYLGDGLDQLDSVPCTTEQGTQGKPSSQGSRIYQERYSMGGI